MTKGQGAFVSGFSKKTKAEKLDWISDQFHNPVQALEVLQNYNHSDKELQTLHDEFTENALTNFYMPLGVAPNFNINDIFIYIIFDCSKFRNKISFFNNINFNIYFSILQ